MVAPACRLCGAPLRHVLADLGSTPLANSYLTEAELHGPETFWPLRAYVCGECFLVQLEDPVSPETIFRDYSYFSSTSDSWVEHARDYVEMALKRFHLGAASRVVEIASNDGYLLQFFVVHGIPVLGIEPARNVAAAAEERGIPSLTEFFDLDLARGFAERGETFDLMIGNNVLAHVPTTHDFVEALRVALAPGGTITLEFPHLLHLIERVEFDTIYHEHFSYFSFSVAERLFAEHGLELVDVEELSTHGGSLRIYAMHAGEDGGASARVEDLRERERAAGLDRVETYEEFERAVRSVKLDLLEFLIGAKREGKTVVGYGAPAKATTLLNYCGVRSDLLEYVIDRSPHKQGRFLPGTHIPIYEPDRVRETQPEYLLILPWNLKDEIIDQMQDVRSFGCRFVLPLPKLEVLA